VTDVIGELFLPHGWICNSPTCRCHSFPCCFQGTRCHPSKQKGPVHERVFPLWGLLSLLLLFTTGGIVTIKNEQEKDYMHVGKISCPDQEPNHASTWNRPQRFPRKVFKFFLFLSFLPTPNSYYRMPVQRYKSLYTSLFFFKCYNFQIRSLERFLELLSNFPRSTLRE